MAQSIIARVRAAHPERAPSNLDRRLAKVAEEAGEIAEAFLNVSSPHNGKNKTWADVREEAVDTLIITLDVALTVMPDGAPADVLERALVADLARAIGQPRSIGFNETIGLVMQINKTASRAYDAYYNPGTVSRVLIPSRFFGMMAECVEAAAAICFAVFPDDTGEDVAAVVSDLLDRKLAKWAEGRARMAVVTDGV